MPRKPKISPRKPPAATTHAAAVERFVRTPESSDVQTSRRSTQVTRKDGRELRRLTVYLSVETSRRLGVRCAQEDRDISDALEEAVRSWLGEGD